MTPALILAAGLSSRMNGGDKLLEPVGGEPLLARMVRIVVEAGFAPFVALPSPEHARAKLLRPHPALFLPGSQEGMGGTLRDGVGALPACARFLILLADLPGLTADDLRAVHQAASAAPQALVWRGANGARPGHPILCATALRPRFAQLHGDDGGRAIMAGVRDQTVLVPLPGDHATRDLDSPLDWARWRAETGL